MRFVDRHPVDKKPELQRTPERDARIRDWLQTELIHGFSSRYQLEAVWREARRQYEGIPRQPVRTSPIPNAPNIEITVGAAATDGIFAQAIDALFTASPLLVTRATNSRWTEHAKAAQKAVNWMADNELRLRHATKNAFLDNTQLGTAGYYIPFVETVRKTDIRRTTQARPFIIPIAPENLLLPAQTKDAIEDLRWVGLRFFYTKTEVQDRARANPNWDISKSMPVAHIDWVYEQRSQMGHITTTATVREFYEFIDIYCYYDYNEDGEDEDLLITYDRSSNSIVALGFNPYDKRPIEKMVYQPRAHLPYGIGVMEMIRPYQEEVTEIHNYKILNSLLASCRLWVAEITSGISESMEVWPNKVIFANDVDSIKELRMSDNFPGLAMFEEAGLRLAEERVGLRGALSMLARGGSRTPATTALSLLQQTNKRFTPAFDEMRLTTAAAIRQALWRYSEVLKVGNKRARMVEKHFESILGEEDAALFLGLLRQDDFEESVSVEFTAASATISRESDRQNALLLTNAMDAQHNQVRELLIMAVNPEAPEPLRSAVIKMITAKNEMFDRLLRTFDLVRDPKTFIADVTPEVRQLEEEQASQEADMAEILMRMPGLMGGIPEPPSGGPA